jgi:hypothetical protein
MRARRRRLVEACKPLTVDGIAGLIAHLPDRAGAREPQPDRGAPDAARLASFAIARMTK